MSSSSPSAVADAAGPTADWPALRRSGLWDLLSERGRRAVLMEGIRTWVERARTADVDATIGVMAGSELELAEAQLTPEAAAATSAEAPPAGNGGPSRAARTIFYLTRLRRQLPHLAPQEIFPYTPVAGTPAFREAWRGWLLRKSAEVADPDRIRRLTTLPIATPGVTGGLFAAGHLLLDPGETLVVADKRWDGYDTTFATILGADLVAHRLFTAAGELDVEAFEDRLREVAPRQRKITAVLNFPNNPTGYMPLRSEVQELQRRVRTVVEATRKPLVLIFDDAYEGYVYDESAYPVSLFYAFVGLHPLCHPVKCDGVTKELLFFGGRLGALTLGIPDEPARGGGEDPRAARGAAGEAAALEGEWENKVSAVLRAIISSAPTPAQAMVTRLLREDLDGALAERERMIAILRRRRERLRALLDAPAARAVFRPDPFNSGFFALLNLRAGSAHEVAHRALRDRRVGLVPLEDAALGINALRLTFGSVSEGQLERLVAALVTCARG